MGAAAAARLSSSPPSRVSGRGAGIGGEVGGVRIAVRIEAGADDTTARRPALVVTAGGEDSRGTQANARQRDDQHWGEGRG